MLNFVISRQYCSEHPGFSRIEIISSLLETWKYLMEKDTANMVNIKKRRMREHDNICC